MNVGDPAPAIEDDPGPVACQAATSRHQAIDVWARRVAIGAAIASAGSCSASVAGLGPWLAFASMALLAGALASLLRLAIPPRRPALAAASYLVRDGYIVLHTGGRERHVGPRQITAAWREEPEGDLHLDLEGGEEVALRVPEARRAALERVLGVRPGGRVLRVPLRPYAATPLARVGAVLGVLGLGPLWFMLAAIVGVGIKDLSSSGALLGMGLVLSVLGLVSAMLWGLVRSLRRRDLVVGADGLHLVSDKMFVPIAKVERVDPYHAGVRVVRKDGGMNILPLPEPPGSPAFIRAQAALLHAIREAKALAGSPRSPKLESLDAAGRAPQAWKSALAALAAGDGNYRVVAVTDDELEQVIGDAASSPERRVGATLALAARDAERARARVRVAAPALADEELREALEAAAEGEVRAEYLARARRR